MQTAEHEPVMESSGQTQGVRSSKPPKAEKLLAFGHVTEVADMFYSLYFANSVNHKYL